ncbi:MAG: GNAT family N-acetyltransferase [Bacteroidota bacterium]
MTPTLVSFDYNHPGYHEAARKIRHTVFVEEQKVPEALEYDEFESVCRHYLMFIDDTAAATCRWRHTHRGIKLERFAVLHEFRGKGLGYLLVRQVLKDVLPENKTIYLHAQEQVTAFYEKLGFRTSGGLFEEAGIGHFLMVYKQESNP